MRTITIVVACILTVSVAMPAYAGRAIIAAATCVPGDPAIQANRYFVTAGSVKRRDGSDGSLWNFAERLSRLFSVGCTDRCVSAPVCGTSICMTRPVAVT
jgi:hypothetical protein